MKITIGITPEHLAEVAKSLNRLLADEHVLYVKTRRAHWNVVGADFLTKHRFFEEQYKELEEIIDDVAERIRTIGHYPEATFAGFLEQTLLTEELGDDKSSAALMKNLLSDHETIIINLRKNIDRFDSELKDAATSDFITGLMATHEKMAWMLRAHL